MKGLFQILKIGTDIVVNTAGGLTAVTFSGLTKLATELIATPAEVIAGSNGLSDGLRKAQEDVTKNAEQVIEVGCSITRHVVKAPIRQAEDIVKLMEISSNGDLSESTIRQAQVVSTRIMRRAMVNGALDGVTGDVEIEGVDDLADTVEM